jgi:hypothetical protein
VDTLHKGDDDDDDDNNNNNNNAECLFFIVFVKLYRLLYLSISLIFCFMNLFYSVSLHSIQRKIIILFIKPGRILLQKILYLLF